MRLFYSNDPRNPSGFVDVIERDGRFLAKWGFQDDSHYHPIEMEVKNDHHFHDAPMVKTFTFGGWRYWMNDVIENSINLTRVKGHLRSTSAPSVSFFEHIYNTGSLDEALQRCRQENPGFTCDKVELIAESYDPCRHVEHFLTCVQCGCVDKSLEHLSLEDLGVTEPILTIEQGVLVGVEDWSLKDGKLVVPDEVIAVGWGACMNCTRLESVVLPDGLKVIDVGAFAACSNLKRIEVPSSVEAIGKYAFRSCGSLTQIVLPETTQVAPDAFESCPAKITYLHPQKTALTEQISRAAAKAQEDSNPSLMQSKQAVR